MKRSFTVVCFAVLFALLLSGGAQAIEIFVWQHDNNLRVNDPVFNSSLTATQAITRTLNALDLDFDLNRNLPNDLSDYDVVITALSFYCPG